MSVREDAHVQSDVPGLRRCALERHARLPAVHLLGLRSKRPPWRDPSGGRAMNVVRIELDERLLRAVDTSRRLRGQTRRQWLRSAVERRVSNEAANIRPVSLRSPEEEDAVRDLFAWIDGE